MSVESCSSEDDVEVDVEECTESEGEVRTCSDTEQGRDSPDSQPVQAGKAKCNCPELLSAQCHLETKELWDKFHELGTEMIITKTGR